MRNSLHKPIDSQEIPCVSWKENALVINTCTENEFWTVER